MEQRASLEKPQAELGLYCYGPGQPRPWQWFGDFCFRDITRDRHTHVMRLKEFEELVSKALGGLPEPVLAMLENVAVTVNDFPTREQMQQNEISDRYELLGLYEGIPLTERPSSYSMVLPDKITIFKGPLEAITESSEMLAAEIQNTIIHELAHHFGFSDEELEDLNR